MWTNILLLHCIYYLIPEPVSYGENTYCKTVILPFPALNPTAIMAFKALIGRYDLTNLKKSWKYQQPIFFFFFVIYILLSFQNDKTKFDSAPWTPWP